MTDRQRALNAHQRVLSALFLRDTNPTYALSKLALESLTSPGEVFLMEDYKLIRYIGKNSNGYPTYQVRF